MQLLLADAWERIIDILKVQLPVEFFGALKQTIMDATETFVEDLTDFEDLSRRQAFRPRLLITGNPGMGQVQLGPALLHALEGCFICNFDLGTLLSETSKVFSLKVEILCQSSHLKLPVFSYS